MAPGQRHAHTQHEVPELAGDVPGLGQERFVPRLLRAIQGGDQACCWKVGTSPSSWRRPWDPLCMGCSSEVCQMAHKSLPRLRVRWPCGGLMAHHMGNCGTRQVGEQAGQARQGHLKVTRARRKPTWGRGPRSSSAGPVALWTHPTARAPAGSSHQMGTHPASRVACGRRPQILGHALIPHVVTTDMPHRDTPNPTR